ncbi:MAG: VIT and vWA domain-containing protein [Planctomycetota bacterium]|jgi:Ca-activated chloride channel family protein
MKALLPALVLAVLAQAQEPGVQGVRIVEEDTKITVKENVARKQVTLSLQNPSNRRVEAVLLFEVDPTEKVEDFRVTIGGKTMNAELLKGDKAKRIYEEIVRKQKDPALLENYGASLIRVRVFPIEPHSTFQARVELLQPLAPQGGLVRVRGVSPLSRDPIAKVSCTMEIEHSGGVGPVFSPTHEVVTSRTGGKATVRYERQNVRSAGSLAVYYGIDESGISAAADDGAFMLTITPPPAERDAMPRDLILAIDTSGSMLEDNKLGQVRAALKASLKTLREGDRFNIIAFSTEAFGFRDGFVAADQADRAVRFVDRLRPRGGTNIEETLTLAAGHEFRDDALPILVFLTDGIPTIGERSTERIRRLVPDRARIFCFGVGYDVNTRLLDLLARDNGGDRQYLKPREEVTQILTHFAHRVNAPVLSNPVIEIRSPSTAGRRARAGSSCAPTTSPASTPRTSTTTPRTTSSRASGRSRRSTSSWTRSARAGRTRSSWTRSCASRRST